MAAAVFHVPARGSGAELSPKRGSRARRTEHFESETRPVDCAAQAARALTKPISRNLDEISHGDRFGRNEPAALV